MSINRQLRRSLEETQADDIDREGWFGDAIAIVASFGFGALLHSTSANMGFAAQETFA